MGHKLVQKGVKRLVCISWRASRRYASCLSSSQKVSLQLTPQVISVQKRLLANSLSLVQLLQLSLKLSNAYLLDFDLGCKIFFLDLQDLLLLCIGCLPAAVHAIWMFLFPGCLPAD